MDKRQPIGVLDSGLGGVSVLRALRDLLPQENYLYFGDSANAPYGIKSEEEIRVLSFNVVEKLVAQGVKAIVIACNTITSAAVTALREKYTDLIIVGTEPAVKPAIFFRPRGKILVMATTATLQGTRFQALVQRWQGEATIIACPCPGLMEFVERGDTQSPELREYLTKKINSVKGWKADCVVLGCTHYPFVQNMIQELKNKKLKLDELRHEIESAEREYDLEKLAKLKYGELPALEKEIADLKNKTEQANESRMLREEVGEEEIQAVISEWTGIPVSKLAESEREKLLHLEDILHKRVIGQDEGVKAVSEAILRARAGLKNENRPVGSFIFLGPTGVGKTELAKALTETLFDTEKNLIRIDMSEYMEKHTVSRLVGSPPGYVGYDEGGQLTEAVRRKPYSVILFDEIEKAHPDVFNILLQLLDDGRLTDNQGRTVDFKNTIIIMTSNLPESQLKTFFRPEFLNRIDDIVVFKSLTIEQIEKIVDLIIESLVKRLEERGIGLELSEDARRFIAKESYDEEFGARPVKRYVQKNIENQIAEMIISNEVIDGQTIKITVSDDSLKFEVR